MPASAGLPPASGGETAATIDEARALQEEALRLCDGDGDVDAAVEHARAALAIATRLGDDGLLASMNQTAGACLVAAHDLAGADEHYRSAVRHARRAGDPAAEVSGEIGRVHVTLLRGALDEAATMLIDLEPVARRSGSPRMLCAVLNNLGNVFDSLHQPQRAIDCFTRALEHGRRHDERVSMGLAMSNLGASLAMVGELDRARDLLEEAIEVYRGLGMRGGEALALGNLALVLERQGRIEEAIEIHRVVLSHFEATGDQLNALTSLTQIAGLLQKRGSHTDALELLTRALPLVPTESFEGWSVHSQLSTSYEALGDAPRALLHYRLATELRQQIDACVNRVALHELQRHVIDNEELQDHHVRDLIAERDRAIEELPAQVQPDAASESSPLGIQQQAEIVGQLRTALADLEGPLSPQSRLALEALLDDLDAPAKHARALQHQVDVSNQRFLQRLSSRFPTLTPAELRVCSLLRANLSTKEIAQLLNVTERNIESHRYAVRRKLGLEKGQQLATWLAAY